MGSILPNFKLQPPADSEARNQQRIKHIATCRPQKIRSGVQSPDTKIAESYGTADHDDL